MTPAWPALALSALLTGCGGDVGTSDFGGDCTSDYVVVAHAPTRPALEATLARKKIRGAEVRQVPDGSWRARVWSQCTD